MGDNYMIQGEIASYGNDKHRDAFLSNPKTDPYVLKAIAAHGNDGHRDKLVNHSNDTVRELVAHNGNDSHRDKLLNDTDEYVRNAIAQKGNIHHVIKLIDDSNEKNWVKSNAMKRKRKLTTGTNESILNVVRKLL
jgi:hypothetical protein